VLKDLLKGVSSWQELKSRISELDVTEKERGDVFEEFAKAYFTLSKEHNFKSVYKLSEAPRNVLEDLNLYKRDILGVDGICIDHDGKTYAYQAKFRTGVKSLTKNDISMFLGYSEKADSKILITTTAEVPKESKQRIDLIINNGHLNDLSEDFFRRLIIYAKEKKIVEPKKIEPHITAREAIAAGVKHYKKNDRGQLILPCGTGKTLVAMWMSEKLKSKSIVIMVPSLALMNQTLIEWANQKKDWKNFRYQCICSDSSTNVDEFGNKIVDSIDEDKSDIMVPVTTKREEIVDFLKSNRDRNHLILCTYNSSEALSYALKKTKTEIDFAIIDEAHRTAVEEGGYYANIKYDRKIPVRKRLFMTATPRVFSRAVSTKLAKDDVPLYDMTNNEIYGDEFYRMNFAEAIERNHITDYRIVIVECLNSLYNELINEKEYVTLSKDGTNNSIFEASALAKRITMIKAMDELKINKAFSFHSSIQKAKEFTSSRETQGIRKIYQLYDTGSKVPGLFHVNGGMNVGERKGLLEDFKNEKKAIMSNARCLAEGVNIPAVDSVIFVSPKKSQVDIIQSTGRALRKDPNNKEKIAYIIVPMFVDREQDIDEIAKGSEFRTVYEIVRAMKDQDSRLEAKISQLRIAQGRNSPETDGVELPVDYFSLSHRVDTEQFIKSINLKIVESVGQNWDFWYGINLDYKKKYGDANCPKRYVTEDEFNLGWWQGHQRANYKIGKLSKDRIEKLDKIGFIWDPFEHQWNEGYERTVKLKKETGDANCKEGYVTEDGFSLGKWQRSQISRFLVGKLSKERIEKLDKIGFVWIRNVLEHQWNEGYEETRKYKEKYGVANCLKVYVTEDDYVLGRWQTTQTMNYNKGILSKEKIDKLEKIGFIWNIFEHRWNKGYEETRKYKEKYGVANCPKRYVTEDDYGLGTWQGEQKKSYKKGKLSRERIEKLEKIGFKWSLK